MSSARWLEHSLGKGPSPDGQSWSEALLGSLNFWGLLEGTHLIALMLFAGTIMVVDLRLLGVTFRKTRVSVISDAILAGGITNIEVTMTTPKAIAAIEMLSARFGDRAIVGVGSVQRASAVRWGVAGNIVWAWIFTIPASGLVAGIFYWVGMFLFA